MNIVIDVSVFIDGLFIYSEERSGKARDLFRSIDEEELTVLEHQVFGVELAFQLVRRKPRMVARRLYEGDS